ncbi:MAG: LUD domain-containing protein [Caldilineaceae bacterium]|nr:LUD domain-containing protein [Caldilineaceae bacterium]
MSTRDNILARLRETLRQPDLPFPSLESPPLTQADRMTVTSAPGGLWAQAERFAQELAAVKGTCELLETVTETRLAIVSRLQTWVEEEQAARKTVDAERAEDWNVICWPPAQLHLDGLTHVLKETGFKLIEPTDLHDPEQRERIRPVRAGITTVEAAFASTGSFVVGAGGANARAASLTPFRHLVVIPFSRLFATAEDWLAEMRYAGGLDAYIRRSRNISIVTGPSKSADLEGNLTMGVHGPKVVHAVLFDDVQE